MKGWRTSDPDLLDAYDLSPPKATDGRHAWRGTQRSLERAIQAAPIPKYDVSYAETFVDHRAAISIPRYGTRTGQIHQKVRMRLAPESLYPRCDWCGTRGSLLVYGRWAFHRRCWMKAQREAPETTKLKPFTAYTIRRPYAPENR